MAVRVRMRVVRVRIMRARVRVRVVLCCVMLFHVVFCCVVCLCAFVRARVSPMLTPTLTLTPDPNPDPDPTLECGSLRVMDLRADLATLEVKALETNVDCVAAYDMCWQVGYHEYTHTHAHARTHTMHACTRALPSH